MKNRIFYLPLLFILITCKFIENHPDHENASLLGTQVSCSPTLTPEQIITAVANGFLTPADQMTFCNHLFIYKGRIPLGFCNYNDVFETFKEMLQTAFSSQRFGMRAPRLFIQGSAITNLSFRRQVPFDDKSDYDIALCDHGFIDVIAQVEKENSIDTIIRTAGLDTNPLTYKHIEALGITMIKNKLVNLAMTNIKGDRRAACTTNDRPAPRAINFKVFRYCRDAILKGASLELKVQPSLFEVY